MNRQYSKEEIRENKFLNIDKTTSPKNMLLPSMKQKLNKSIAVKSKLDTVPKCLILKKENIRRKKLEAIKETCIFKALETYHQVNRDQKSQIRWNNDSEFFEMESNDSSDINNNSECNIVVISFVNFLYRKEFDFKNDWVHRSIRWWKDS